MADLQSDRQVSEEIPDSVLRAYQRLDARPPNRQVCGYCGHESEVEHDPGRTILKCSECGTRIAFGSTMPKVYVTPHVDRRFLSVKFEPRRGGDVVEVTLDRQFWGDVAIEVLSVAAPALYRVVRTAIQKLQNLPGENPGPPST